MKVRKPTPAEIANAKNWGIWTKEPSVFPWHYETKETCYILDGKAEVSDEKGNTIVFQSGDWVEFEKGLTCTWNVVDTIRKHYHFS